MMDVREIMQYLPHRYPFLLVDRILELEKNKRIVGIKNVTINEHFFQGHFPGEPIMPGVLIVEAMAQTAGILAISSLEMKNASVYFMSIDNAKFRKPVVPGDQVRITCEVTRTRGMIWKIKGSAHVEDALVAEGELTAMLSDKPMSGKQEA